MFGPSCGMTTNLIQLELSPGEARAVRAALETAAEDFRNGSIAMKTMGQTTTATEYKREAQVLGEIATRVAFAALGANSRVSVPG